MSWKPHFQRGTALFKQGKHSEALEAFDEAITKAGDQTPYILYDSRAAVYEALDNPSGAIQDAKKTIKLAPQQWQGYARAARLFMKTHHFESSLKMIDLALSNVNPNNNARREELVKLKQEISNAKDTVTKWERRMRNYVENMPIEVLTEVFRMVIAEDCAQIITLLHVCGRWRQAVWDDPGLWHTLVLSRHRPQAKTSLWVERSRGRMRELRVRDYFQSSSFPEHEFFKKVDWSYLRICRIDNADFLRRIEPATAFCGLEYLDITAGGSVDEDFFQSATEVKTLLAQNTSLGAKHFSNALPNLTSLTLSHCSFGKRLPEDFFRTLVFLPKLQSLCLQNVHSWPNRSYSLTDPTILDSIVLPDLTNLEVISSEWAPYLLLLDIPALRTLRLQEIPPNRHFRHWLSTGPQFLTELSLISVFIDPALLIQILRSIHTIESLSLVNIYESTNTIINALVEGPVLEGAHLACVCPKLRELDVSRSASLETSTVHALVKQRLALSAVDVEDEALRVNKLEVLKMDECHKIDIEWLPWFREHVTSVSCRYATKKTKRSTAKRVNGF